MRLFVIRKYRNLMTKTLKKVKLNKPVLIYADMKEPVIVLNAIC